MSGRERGKNVGLGRSEKGRGEKEREERQCKEAKVPECAERFFVVDVGRTESSYHCSL